jgi:hypothetical protein
VDPTTSTRGPPRARATFARARRFITTGVITATRRVSASSVDARARTEVTRRLDRRARVVVVVVVVATARIVVTL